MVDGPNQEEEYQFTDDTATDQYQQARSMARSRANDSEQMRKRVFIVAGVILVVVVGYQMIGLLNTKPAADLQNPHEIVTPPLSTVTPSPASTQNLNTELVDSHLLEDVKVQHTQTRKDLINMTAALVELRQTLKDMDSRLVDLNYSQKQLSGELSEQKQALTKIQNRQTKQMKPAVKRAVYFIKAVIRGRAWLKAENGSTLITVKVGDQVPGYGKIAEIDHDEGKVITRQGEVITFDPNDR